LKYRERSENRGRAEYSSSILRFFSWELPFSSVLLVSDRIDAIVILGQYIGGCRPSYAVRPPESQVQVACFQIIFKPLSCPKWRLNVSGRQ